MPTFTLNGQPLEYGPFKTGTGKSTTHHPAQVLDLWSDQQLAAIGVTRMADPAPPTPPRTCSVFDLMYGRVALAERLAIRASTDPIVVDFVAALQIIPRVELDGALTVQGVQYLESIGLLPPGRAAEILA